MELRFVLFCCAFLFLAGPNKAFAESTDQISKHPILFVHGFNEFGIGDNCETDWGKMENGLTAAGYTGLKIKIGYYSNDSHCDASVAKGNILTSIPDLSKALAWYIYNQFSEKGIEVDVVAHSMGGLMTRYALYRVSLGDQTYPPFLRITHVSTVGTPFTGYSLLAETCHANPANMECNEMAPYSHFISELRNPLALLPMGIGGTLWSNIGSNASVLDSSDGFVGSASATSMNIPKVSKTIMPWYKFVFHTGYSRNKNVIKIVSQYLAMTPGNTGAIDSTSEVESNSLSVATPADVTLSRDEIFQDLSKVPEESRPGQTQPYIVDSNSEGVQFTKILPSGIFARMGIQDNDIVQGCTPATVNEPFLGLASLENPGKSGQFQFCIIRNGTLTARVITVK